MAAIMRNTKMYTAEMGYTQKKKYIRINSTDLSLSRPLIKFLQPLASLRGISPALPASCY